MSWSSILAPLGGGTGDAEVLEAAACLAERFGAELAAVYAPPDPADVLPWSGEGFLGGAQMAALDSLRVASDEAEARARSALDRITGARKRFCRLDSPIWASLCAEARFSDLAVFAPDAARGRGLLAEAFQHVLMEERRPVFVRRRRGLDRVAVAWDGGREATRAARVALPWLCTATEVVVIVAPEATPRRFDPRRLQAWFQAHGLSASTEVLNEPGEPGPLVATAVDRVGADVLVAGAFGHPRFQRFIFGGATRSLLASDDGPSLFLTH
jgi:nucleotide-binding universal stress UspA family protein